MKIVISDEYNPRLAINVSSAAELIAVIYEGSTLSAPVQTLLHALATDLTAFATADELGFWINIDPDDDGAHAWLQGGHADYRLEPGRGWREFSELRGLGRPQHLAAICSEEAKRLRKQGIGKVIANGLLSEQAK